MNKAYVVFDIETTGFSPYLHRITEIGAVKIENGIITEEFHQLIDPGVPVPWRITEITGITDELLAGQPTIEGTLPLFFEFCSDCALVAHNANFDMGFIKPDRFGTGATMTIGVIPIKAKSWRDIPHYVSDAMDEFIEIKKSIETRQVVGDC